MIEVYYCSSSYGRLSTNALNLLRRCCFGIGHYPTLHNAYWLSAVGAQWTTLTEMVISFLQVLGQLCALPLPNADEDKKRRSLRLRVHCEQIK